MPERWQNELEKVDLLEPAEDLQDRIGHVPTRERREAPGHRIAVGLTALAIFAAAGLFAWRVFDPGSQQAVSTGTSSGDLPQVVDVTCSTGGAQVTPEANVTDHGIRFRVANPAGMDEVIIVGTGDGTGSADMDLSSGTDYTFESLPPDRYLVGCFTDQNRPTGTHDDFLNAPGMVPVLVTDPEGFYVSDALSCTGDMDSGQQHYGYPAGTLPASETEVVRNLVSGLDPTDTVERSGYSSAPESRLLAYRIVRQGEVIARGRMTIWESTQASVRVVDMQWCLDSGLGLRPPPA